MPENEKKSLSEGISKLADVIKKHEGYYIEGSRAQRNNNPGNLTASPFPNKKEFPNKKDKGFCIFPDKETGEKALNHQLNIIFTGDSRHYKPTTTIEEFVNKWASTSKKVEKESYAKSIAKEFKTTKDKTLKEAFEKNGYDLSGKEKDKDNTHPTPVPVPVPTPPPNPTPSPGSGG